MSNRIRIRWDLGDEYVSGDELSHPLPKHSLVGPMANSLDRGKLGRKMGCIITRH